MAPRPSGLRAEVACGGEWSTEALSTATSASCSSSLRRIWLSTRDGIEWTVFDDVDPNPTDANVAAGVESLRGFGTEGAVMVSSAAGRSWTAASTCGRDVLRHAIEAYTSTATLRDLIILNTPRYPSREEVHALYEQAM